MYSYKERERERERDACLKAMWHFFRERLPKTPAQLPPGPIHDHSPLHVAEARSMDCTLALDPELQKSMGMQENMSTELI